MVEIHPVQVHPLNLIQALPAQDMAPQVVSPPPLTYQKKGTEASTTSPPLRHPLWTCRTSSKKKEACLQTPVEASQGKP